MEELRQRRRRAHREGRRTGLKEAWEEHEWLELALKRMIRREHRRLHTQEKDELLNAPLGERVEAMKFDNNNKIQVDRNVLTKMETDFASIVHQTHERHTSPMGLPTDTVAKFQPATRFQR